VSIDLSSPEVKEAIKAAVEEATAPLIAKRDELLREVKQARKGQQVDPETVTKLEDQIEALKGELTTAQKAAKNATSDAEKARKALEGTEARLSKTVKESGLIDALTKAGVTNPVHLKAAKALLADQVQVAAEGEGYALKVGDKALAEFAAEWAKGDEGKHFVPAPTNGGGGSQGGGGAPGTPKTLADAKTDDERKAVIAARLAQATANAA
jgi:predicted RNase H-like nuclease (RuvC/YqgF family)